jgi:hypothetical protein
VKTKVLLAIFAISILLMAGGCSGSSPSRTVKDFYGAIGRGDVETATAQMASRVIDQVGLNKLQQSIEFQVQAVEQAGGIKSVKITDEQIFDDAALVTTQVDFGDGTSATETVQLVKEDGRWKIDISK